MLVTSGGGESRIDVLYSDSPLLLVEMFPSPKPSFQFFFSSIIMLLVIALLGGFCLLFEHFYYFKQNLGVLVCPAGVVLRIC